VAGRLLAAAGDGLTLVEARVVHNSGRADQLDRAALQRLVNRSSRVLVASIGALRYRPVRLTGTEKDGVDGPQRHR
jgi:hypothetical protein